MPAFSQVPHLYKYGIAACIRALAILSKLQDGQDKIKISQEKKQG